MVKDLLLRMCVKSLAHQRLKSELRGLWHHGIAEGAQAVIAVGFDVRHSWCSGFPSVLPRVVSLVQCGGNPIMRLTQSGLR